ncbi:MAG: heavy metal translocating P-type ATPase, partial [Lysobacterales bacterium]
MSEDTLRLQIAEMSCAACVARVERALLRVPGVQAASVNLATEIASVDVAPGTATEALVQAVAAAGYRAAPLVEHTASAPAPPSRDWLWAALLSAPLALPMLALPFGVHAMLPGWLQWLLATPVQCWLGARFYRAGWQALRDRAGNMDQLVALGTSAAYGLSVYHLLRGQTHTLYFEASAVVITLVLLGKALEARAKRQTSAAIRALQALQPEIAEVWRDGHWQTLPIQSLQPGDELRLLPGARVPADSVVLEGDSLHDESLLTGEALPVARGPGDAVTGGAINGEGVQRLRVLRVGADSTLARIVRLVED